MLLQPRMQSIRLTFMGLIDSPRISLLMLQFRGRKKRSGELSAAVPDAKALPSLQWIPSAITVGVIHFKRDQMLKGQMARFLKYWVPFASVVISPSLSKMLLNGEVLPVMTGRASGVMIGGLSLATLNK